MDFEPVHMHKSRIYSSTNVFLLLIPSLIFALVLGFYLLSLGSGIKTDIATTAEPSILGKQSDQLDKD